MSARAARPLRLALSVAGGALLLISVFLGPRLYWDRTLLVGDGVYYADPSFRSVGRGVFTTAPHNFLAHVDHLLNGYPHRTWIQASLRQGEIPWWNPYIGMGVPQVTDPDGVLEPLAVLLGFLVPATKLPNALAVGGLLVALTGMYALLGRLGAGPAARALGAIAFAFSGWSIAWLGRSAFLTEIWLPWIVWAALRFRARPGVAAGALLALVAALVCHAGHLQTAFHVFATLGVVVAVTVARSAEPGHRRVGLVLAMGAAVAVGIGAALSQLVPMLDLLAQSDLPVHGRARVAPAGSALAALGHGLLGDWALLRSDGPTAISAVAPFFFGSPVDSTWFWPAINLMETTLYVGLAPLFFALWGASRRRDVPGIGLWLGLAGVAAGVACGLPVLNLVNYLPGFDVVNNGRLRLVYRFALVVAAALAFDRFATRAGTPGRRPWAIAGFALGVLLAPAALVVLLRRLGLLPTPPPALGGWSVLDVLGRHAPGLVVLAVLITLVLGAWRGRLSRRPFGIAVVALAFLDLLWHLGSFTPAVPSAYVFPRTPLVRFLEADPSLFRVSSTVAGGVLVPNTKLPYRLFDVDMFSVLNVDRYARLQAAVTPPRPPGLYATLRLFRELDPERWHGLLDLMNVKYLVVPQAPDRAGHPDPVAGRPAFRLAWDGDVRVWENLRVLPRAFLVSRARVVDSPAAALATVTHPDFDPRAAVLLEDPAAPALPPAPPGASAGSARVTSLSANRVVVRADSPHPAYLVLSEVFYPGWHARRDGAPVPIFRADYLFRAVHLPAGEHEVVFTFWPSAYALAAAGSLLAGALIAAGLLAGLRRRRLTSPGADG